MVLHKGIPVELGECKNENKLFDTFILYVNIVIIDR